MHDSHRRWPCDDDGLEVRARAAKFLTQHGEKVDKAFLDRLAAPYEKYLANIYHGKPGPGALDYQDARTAYDVVLRMER